MAKLKTCFSPCRAWTLWNSLSLFTTSSVPPSGIATTCGVNSQFFWSSLYFCLKPRGGFGPSTTQITAFFTPPAWPTTSDSSALFAPQDLMSRVTGRLASLGASPAIVTFPETLPFSPPLCGACARSARTAARAIMRSPWRGQVRGPVEQWTCADKRCSPGSGAASETRRLTPRRACLHSRPHGVVCPTSEELHGGEGDLFFP